MQISRIQNNTGYNPRFCATFYLKDDTSEILSNTKKQWATTAKILGPKKI